MCTYFPAKKSISRFDNYNVFALSAEMQLRDIHHNSMMNEWCAAAKGQDCKYCTKKPYSVICWMPQILCKTTW